MLGLFDAWIENDDSSFYIRSIDNWLHQFFGLPPECCEYREDCSNLVTIEWNGDVYPCDFFVEPRYRMGNVLEQTLEQMLNGPAFRSFVDAAEHVPAMCAKCEYLRFCHAGCFRHRQKLGIGQEEKPYLCEANKRIFSHAFSTLWEVLEKPTQPQLHAFLNRIAREVSAGQHGPTPPRRRRRAEARAPPPAPAGPPAPLRPPAQPQQRLPLRQRQEVQALLRPRRRAPAEEIARRARPVDEERTEIAIVGKTVYLKPIGMATQQNCLGIPDFLETMFRIGCRHVVFDLAHCTGMDSTFLGVIADAATALPQVPGKTVLVINAGERVRQPAAPHRPGAPHQPPLRAGQPAGGAGVPPDRLRPLPPDRDRTHHQDQGPPQEAGRDEREEPPHLRHLHHHAGGRAGATGGGRLRRSPSAARLPPHARRQGEMPMKFAMCNEFCEGWDFERVCRLARPQATTASRSRPSPSPTPCSTFRRGAPSLRETARRTSLDIVGLHWLLVKPEGLHLNSPDPQVRRRTLDYLHAEVDFCADVGGARMVIGSPKQRNVPENETYEQVWQRTVAAFRPLAEHAAERGVCLCIEPLGAHGDELHPHRRRGAPAGRGRRPPRLPHDAGREGHVRGRGADPRHHPRLSAAYLKHFHANDESRLGPGLRRDGLPPHRRRAPRGRLRRLRFRRSV